MGLMFAGSVVEIHFRLVAYGRQPGDVDRARRDTILAKSVPMEILHWFNESGTLDRLHRSLAPVHLPANRTWA